MLLHFKAGLALRHQRRLNIFDIILIQMQRLDFQLDFVRILYKAKTKKDFRVRLELLDKEGNEVKAEQLDIPIDSDVVELNKMGKFELYLIAGEEKTYFLPFSLHFIANSRPVIRRKIPVRLHSIHQHYLQDYQEIGPLEQVYTFEQGEIIYKVTITGSQPIIDKEEIRSYDQRLCVLSGSTFVSLIDNNFLPQLSKGEQFQSNNELNTNYEVNSKISRLEDVSKITSRTKAQADPNDSQDEDTSERGNGDFEQSWQRLSQIYDDQPKAEEQPIERMKDNNLSLKLICILITIGFILLLVNAFQGQAIPNKKPIHKAKPKPTKANQKKAFKTH